MSSTTQRTLDQIFQHPISHNLEWRDVRSLFESIGQVEAEHNGNLKVTLSGQQETFQSPNNNRTASADQVSQIRHFLEASGKTNRSESGQDLLVVMDHKEAKIYHTEMKGSVPEEIKPYDPLGHKGHVHSSHDYPDHSEHHNYDSYFSDIAKAISEADKILIFGSGGGDSNAMNTFVLWIAEHEKKLSERVIGAVTIDAGHLTEGQLLAKAREIYAK